jgi:hypothetical protein
MKAMKEIQGSNTSNMVRGNMVLSHNETPNFIIESSKLMIAQIIRKLEDLFLLKTARLYIEMWNTLKADIMELTRTQYIIADNKHILKLIKTVEKLITISKKQKSSTAALSYTAVFCKRLEMWQGPPIKHKVSI